MTASDLFHDAVWLFFHAVPSRFGRWQNPDLIYPEGVPTVWTSPYELRKLTVSWSRSIGLTPPQDAAQCTFHFLNLTGGDPDDTWTDTDFTTVESAFDAFWTAIKPRYAPVTELTEYEWRKDGPAYRPHSPAPGGLLSPTVRAVSRAVVGTGGGTMLPPQCAISVTEVVPAKYTAHLVEGVGDQVRNRWGRFYLPAPATVTSGGSSAITDGRISSALAQLVADSCQDFYDACNAADIVPVMYSPTTGSSWAVQSIHVDDIWDVIRSRRFVEPASRHVVALTSPPPEL
jgi:hypothetical protein